MEAYYVFKDLAIIIIFAKFFGILARKLKAPQVVGEIIAGLLIGPSILGLVQQSDFLLDMAEIGVVLLMFSAGLETNLKELLKTGPKALLIACAGVFVPLIGGALLYMGFYGTAPWGSENFYKAVFMGVILTATSVSITVETLKEMGKLNTPASNAILGAAIIDDVLGIIALTIITSFSDDSVNIIFVLIKIVLFFIFAVILGIGMYYLFKWINKSTKRDSRRHVIIAFAYCLISAFCAEVFFGVADITGAYIAGLVLSMTNRKMYLENRFATLSYMLLSPIFFAGIGLTIELPSMSVSLIIFAILLTIVAVISKFFGCALGGKICGYSTRECFQIGAGMISRGEVALIVAKKGEGCGLMDPALFGPLVIVVVITTIVAPVILKLLFDKKNDKQDSLPTAKEGSAV